MMRVAFLTIPLLLSGGLLALWLLAGVSPLVLTQAGNMAAGLGAKLACSHRYLSGIGEAQVKADLESYSGAYALVELSYDDSGRRVHARAPWHEPVSATHRRGLGCTLDIGDVSGLEDIKIPAVAETDSPWPAGPVVTTRDTASQRALDRMLARDNAAGYQTRALLLVRDGVITAESYAAGFDAGTPLLGWSMGKSLIGLLLGTLEYRGLLQVDERLLFPGWQQDARADIALENLLQMTSGLAFAETYLPGFDATRMLFQSHSAAQVALASPLQHVPGSYFSYSSGTSNLLAKLYWQRTGSSLQAAVNDLYGNFLQPMAMRHTVLEPDPGGIFVASSFVYASARDWARMGQLLLNNGQLNGRRLLAGDWVRRSVTPNGSGNDPRYGYQLWLNRGGNQRRWPELPPDAYAMLGNRSQVVMMVPSARAVLVRLGWSRSDYPLSTRFAELLQVRPGTPDG